MRNATFLSACAGVAWIICLGFVVPEARASCPAYIDGASLPKEWLGQTVSHLRAFAKVGATWREIPVQVQDVEPKPGAPSSVLTLNHRLAVRVEDFGDGAAPLHGLPCADDVALVVEDRASHGAKAGPVPTMVILNCDDASPQTPERKSFSSPVTFDSESLVVSSPEYRYRFSADNKLLFDEIWMTPPGDREEAPVLVARRADIAMELKVGRLFRLDFDRRDVEARSGLFSIGPIGASTPLDFGLRILFFRLKLKLGATASFFPSTAHIPMVVESPADARKTLNPGSGFVYSWEDVAGRISDESIGSLMPEFDESLVKGPPEALAALGLKYCRERDCQFGLRGEARGRRYSMEFRLERELVEQGFFPMFLRDASVAPRALGWKKPVPGDGAPRVGVFYNVAGMKKGTRRMDNWIQMEASQAPVRDATGALETEESWCPRQVSVNLISPTD